MKPLRFLRSAGFTMIELLVVIAIIGILAVAVLSTLDPIEQINKGRDTRNRSDGSQLLSAVDRYYASQEQYPWVAGATTTCGATSNAACAANDDTIGQLAAPIADWVDLMVTTGEVKEQFAQRVTTNTPLMIFKEAGENGQVSVCFLPTSKSFKAEADTRCGATGFNGAPAGACGDTAGTLGDDYICLP